jgi:hypothetical protein
VLGGHAGRDLAEQPGGRLVRLQIAPGEHVVHRLQAGGRIIGLPREAHEDLHQRQHVAELRRLLLGRQGRRRRQDESGKQQGANEFHGDLQKARIPQPMGSSFTD